MTNQASVRFTAPAQERLHGLDWLRAGAAVLVVLLHAGIPYLTHPMPGLIWAAKSRHVSPAVNLLCWGIDGFIMPLFFLMTGFFGSRLLEQRGAREFLKHRLQRIGGPFLFACVAILPLDLYAWLLGWAGAGMIEPRKLRSLKVDGPLGEALWGVSHLWYLEYVLAYCLAGWSWHALVPARIRTRGRALLRAGPAPWSWSAILMGSLLAGAALWLKPRIVIGFHHGWLPWWENLAYYAVPFLLGWAWGTPSPDRAATLRGSLLKLAGAMALFAALWPRLLTHLENESAPAQDVWVPCLFAGFALLMSVGLFGLALSLRVSRRRPSVAAVAEASFWIYLLHHPLVGLTHVDLALVDWPPEAEFCLAAGVTLAVCLLTYEALVRRTWIGVLLNGQRVQPEAESPQAQSAPSRRRAA